MKKTLLEIVQEILNDMDSEPVNSLSDSIEAVQIASIVQSTFENIVATRYIPEHSQLIQLTPLSDSSRPTYFVLQANTRKVENVWYNVGTSSETEYRELTWLAPLQFLQLNDNLTGALEVTDINSATTFKVATDKQPTYYTSFDDAHIVCDSYNNTVDTNLQASKSRAYGTVYPTFSQTDSFVPDLDSTMFRYLINESKSMAMSLLKAPNGKVDQAARRQKQYVQNDTKRLGPYDRWNSFGRS